VGSVPPTREILRLLAAVNARRQDDVSLPALAAMAHRSRFNLHRAFRAVVGETPRAYTSRVRLVRAAADLLATERSVVTIAYDHGFGSHAAFTRAFTRYFGVSPTAYRLRGIQVDDDRSVDLHAAVIASVAPCVGLYRMSTAEGSTVVPIDIVVKDLPAIPALVIRQRVARDQVASALAGSLPRLFDYATRSGLAMTGPPFSRYPQVGLGSLVIEGGVQLAAPAPTPTEDGIEAITIPGGPAAVAIHHGPYDGLVETYAAIEEWLENEGREAGGPPWEVYLTDPGEYPDPQTWQTEVIQPLA
jgi:AraC family transcriptional regulator